MKILVDENIPRMTIAALRNSQHDVKEIHGTDSQGISDDKVWQVCQRESRLLITTDKGFSRFRNEKHYGILIIRLNQPNRKKIHERVMLVFSQRKSHDWIGLMVVMRDHFQSSTKAKGK